MFARSALEVARTPDQRADESIEGRRCERCRRTSALPLVRCPRCRAPMNAARFGPEGTVWSATVVHLERAGSPLPYQLAYLDLDDGARLLVGVEAEAAAAVGSRLRLCGRTEAGAPTAVPA